jgi:HlyD family secretion protein
MINNSSWLPIGLLVVAGCADGRGLPPGYQGIVELDERHLGFEVGGRLAEVAVVRGQAVAAGQLIARLDDGLEQPIRAARAADVAAARAQLALLRAGARAEDVRAAAAEERAADAAQAKVESNLGRARKLLADGAVNRSEVDNLEQDARRAAEEAKAQSERVRLLRAGSRPEEVAAAEARVAGAEAALTAEEARLARFTLKADRAGVVLDVDLRAGEVAGPGVPVVTVADVAHPFIDVFVPVPELAGLAVGRAARARVDGVAAILSGTIEDVGRQTEFTPRFLFSEKERPHLVVRVRVRVEDPEARLHAGIPAFVTLPEARTAALEAR